LKDFIHLSQELAQALDDRRWGLLSPVGGGPIPASARGIAIQLIFPTSEMPATEAASLQGSRSAGLPK